MKNKIGQITYCGYNFGSILQTYATQQIFAELNYSVEYLDICEKGVKRYVYYARVLLAKYRNYLLYPQYIKKFKAMSSNAKKKNLSTNLVDCIEHNKRFFENEINSVTVNHKQLKELAENEYAVLLSGSDQIWNAAWYTVRSNYFLAFAPPEKRIAFAPSFGKAKVADYNIKPYTKLLNQYRMLSAREESGVEIIKELTGKDAVLVLDPTLLLSSERWLKLMGDKYNVSPPDTDYILTYFIDRPSSSALEYIRKKSSEGNKIVGFGIKHDELNSLDNYIYAGGGPCDFIKLISNAGFVVTDSFHGIAFAINFKKQFYAFRREYIHGSDQSERLFSILKICGLENRFTEDCSTITDAEIDFDDVGKRLEPHRKTAMDYVKRITQIIDRS